MSNYNIGLSADSKTAHVTVLSDVLPGGATNVLTDFTHGDGEAADGVHDNPNNHVLYHDVRDALFRQEGIQDMQRISISVSGALAAASLSAADLAVVGVGTDTIEIVYQPAAAAAVNADFTFVSNNVAVATVAATGVVTGVAAGTTTITATHKATGATIDVVVVAT